GACRPRQAATGFPATCRARRLSWTASCALPLALGPADILGANPSDHFRRGRKGMLRKPARPDFELFAETVRDPTARSIAVLGDVQKLRIPCLFLLAGELIRLFRGDLDQLAILKLRAASLTLGLETAGGTLAD